MLLLFNKMQIRFGGILQFSPNGKLGITFHRFPVDKYAKENWIVRIRRYVGKNFRLVIVAYDFKLCKLYLKSVCSAVTK